MKNDPVYWALAPEFSPAPLNPAECRLLTPEEQGANPASQIMSVTRRVAVISIRGELAKETFISIFNGRIYRLGYDLIRAALQSALADPKISSILLSIDSPGGTVSGAKELADFIAEGASLKPMAAYADGLMASAAYWLGAATGTIYAPATALVGSIGVIMRLEDWTGYYTKAGVRIEYIAAGEYKAAGQDARELTEKERTYFAGQLAALHAIFREDVKNRMAITADETLWAEAQLMPASTAAPLGLVSAIVPDQDNAIKMLARKTEDNMDLSTLKAEHPDLVSALLAENQAKAQAEAQNLAERQKDDLLAIVKTVAGPEAAEKVRALAASGITASQLEAIAPLLRAEPKTDGRAEMLEALQKASNDPVSQTVEAPKVNRLLADAEKRSRA